MSESLDIAVVIDLANQVGARVAREYPGIDSEDLVQEAIAGLYERRDWISSTDPDYLYTVMNGIANAYAAKERYDYTINSSNYVYRPKEVRAILEEAYFQISSHDVPTAKEDYLSAEIGKGTVFVSIMDIRTAWQRLSKAHADILNRKFRDGNEVHRETVARAVDALTRAMNIHINRQTDADGPGSRKALSNAQAQHAVRAESGFEGKSGRDALDEYQSL